MGRYLNSSTSYVLYKNETMKPYFVDKTKLLSELFPFLEVGNTHICITRPRRFGKTMIANMIASFLGKRKSENGLFESLNISQNKEYIKYKNQYDVIFIDFSKMPRECHSYREYIDRIEENLIRDLKKAYPDIEIYEGDSAADVLETIFEEYDEQRFIFVFDEWDFIFHKDFIKEEDKKQYILFLSNLLKDRPYVIMTYMTGILPIAKYSSGSELNMFWEYNMASETKYSEYFGFTDEEVDELFERYEHNNENAQISRQDLRIWYDGYTTKSGERIYNPRSVVLALTNNNIGNYWTSSGPYDEIFYYIRKNIDDVQNDLALMISGESVQVKIQEYAAAAMRLETKSEIFSAMVVYGLLSYEDGKVRIPNKELMNKFDDMIQKEESLGYVYRLAKESERMLQATLAEDTQVMEEILEYAHNTETPILSYNNETELSAIINLVYLSARDKYRVEREDKAGKGFVDYIFYPENKKDPGIILELKVDHSPREALKQIVDKDYKLKFQGKIGEIKTDHKILGVGISYDKKTKKHSCVTQWL